MVQIKFLINADDYENVQLISSEYPTARECFIELKQAILDHNVPNGIRFLNKFNQQNLYKPELNPKL